MAQSKVVNRGESTNLRYSLALHSAKEQVFKTSFFCILVSDMLNRTPTSFYHWVSLLIVQCCISYSVNSQIDATHIGEKMDSLFFQEDRSKEPGYSVAIVKNDSVIYQRSIGLINVEKRIAFDENSVFAIASCTKQFTAFGILLLEHEGKLKLDDDVRKYIPELPDFGATVKLKHLLSHTSGIRDHLIVLDWKNKQSFKDYTFKGTIRGLQHFSGLCFQPGENFAYSNTGYVLLAMVIERVSEKTINEFMHERIFDPLQMNNTEFRYKRDYRNIGCSRPYNYDWKKADFITYRFKEVNAMGAVGIYTTINDFIKWDQNFRSMSVGNNAIFEKFLQSDTLNNGLIINYNHGLKERFVKGYHVVEHSGGWAFYNCQYTQIPELGLSIIIAANNEFDYPIGMAETFINAILPNDRILKNPSEELSKSTAQTRYYLSDQFILRAVEFDENGNANSIRNASGSKRYPMYIDSNGGMMDSTGNEFVWLDRKDSFQWSGGGYFNVPTVFRALDQPKNDFKEINGKFENAEFGTLRIRFNQRKEKLIIKSSFGRNPKMREMYSNYCDLDGVDYDLLIQDHDTLIIGNSIVFNLVFTRK